MDYVVYFIGAILMHQHYGVDCNSDTEISQLLEKASRTFIAQYHDANLSKSEVQELSNRLKDSCNCDVEHLPLTRTFILTHEETNGIKVDGLDLPSGVAIKPDKFLNISLDADYRDIVKLSSSHAEMDPGYHLQWAFQNLSNNADINAEMAWQIYQSDRIGGSAQSDKIVKYKGAIVAVVDTGIDYNHPDLKDVMWTNPGEIPDNEIDDDNNGIIDDYYGADFSGVKPKGDPMDKSGHGTHCAGVIAAKANNGDGIRGVASFVKGKVKVMAIKCFSGSDSGLHGTLRSNSKKCMEYLLKNGANISSHSYMVPEDKSFYEEAFYNILKEHPNHLAVACSGNGGQIVNDENKLIPCSVKSKNMLCVASSTNENTRSAFSNIGKEHVDVFAPGSHILSTYLNADYMYMWGTSMATPHVAGLAALIKSMRVRLNGNQVRKLIVKNVNKVEAYDHLVSSGGLIDMAKTISATRKLK